ncbi:alpha/beta hydrolase [Actinoplanes sp. TFC3]|uniref:alpha/beta hydrolase n=1 Tax=Actinoplanes sp. TFC3 TaxID=1710355 RepID=UPI000829C6AD|nr:alpha/beta hydrolase [Actinoplanes sp. TFC3]
MISGILIPGGTGTIGTLLDLAWETLADRTAHVEAITWDAPRDILDGDPEPFVRAHVEQALAAAQDVAPPARPVLIGKSLGSYAAALAADRSLPAIWITPLLTRPGVVAAITRNPAPQLLIGGTADRRWWDEEAARSTGQQVLSIAEGTHSLRVPGPIRKFTDVLGTAGTAIEEFLDAMGR